MIRGRRNQLGRKRNRRGGIYFAVAGVCMLVATMAIGAAAAARLQARAVAQSCDFDAARLYARCAIELGTYLANQQGFRNTYSNGTWVSNQTIGSGALTIQGSNVNSALPLNNSDTDSILLTGIGSKGPATHKSQATLVPSIQPLSCLAVAEDCGGNMSLSNTVNGTATLASNASIVTSGSLNGTNLEAVGTIGGTGFGTGTRTQHAAPRGLPASTAFDYYTKNGTSISFGSIPSATIQKALLSPSSNPYGGGTNASGIYVINCGGNNITIGNCRVVGTLVLLNAGTGSLINNPANFAPFVANYPCLMVQGNIKFNIPNGSLSESTTGANFNPPGTPYNGVSNTTNTDTYPSQFQGLVYVSGNLTSAQYFTMNGVVIAGGTFTSTGVFSPTYAVTWYNNPPPGFYVTPVKMVVSPSTWAQYAQ